DYQMAFDNSNGQVLSNPDLRRLLDEFINLSESPDERIMQFAGKWGVLGVCKHGVPFSGCREDCQEGYLESISTWRIFSRMARAILSISANLHQGIPGKNADWSTIFSIEIREQDDWFEAVLDKYAHQFLSAVPDSALNAIRRSILAEDKRREKDSENIIRSPKNELAGLANLQKLLLGWLIDAMLVGSGIRLAFNWKLAEPKIELSSSNSLLGALACQLAFAVLRSDAIAICSACGTPYTPNRRPAASRRNYCLACGKKAANRDHARQKRISNQE
ncbi:MAG TPA: hypothetical protein VFR55_13815, partial [Dehalococcoidia bacterium]|nr:hypothetical protein [Dehalococcoidia bacterium]